jgi:hypothetical protein
MLIGSSGMLVRGGCPFLSRTDSGLCLLVDLLNLAASFFYLLTVPGGLLAYLIHFGLDRRSGVPNVLLSSAAASKHGTCHDASGRKESFHSVKNLATHFAIRKPLLLTGVFAI